jgi:hypothetical protein
MTTSRCLAWYLNDNYLERYLENGPKFYPPMRCKELCVGNECVCATHLKKRENPPSNLNKNRSGAYWGLVNEPIRNFGDGKNYLALGPWFMEKAKQLLLSEEKMRKLKAQYAAATEGVPNAPPMPSLNAAAVAVPEVAAVASEPVKKKTGRKKKEEVVVATPAAAPAPAPAAEPVKKKRGPKKAVSQVAAADGPIVGVVLEPKPVAVEDFVEVSVRPFEHAGTLYYLDPKKQKLYDRARDGSTKGLYKGRWDSSTETIVSSIPDSDAE